MCTILANAPDNAIKGCQGVTPCTIKALVHSYDAVITTELTYTSKKHEEPLINKENVTAAV